MDKQRQARVLNDAADIIERDGWWNGEGAGFPHYKEGATVCAVIAMKKAYGFGIDSRIGDVAASFATFLGLPSDERIAPWNDEQESGDIVVQALRDCAYKLSLDAF